MPFYLNNFHGVHLPQDPEPQHVPEVPPQSEPLCHDVDPHSVDHHHQPTPVNLQVHLPTPDSNILHCGVGPLTRSKSRKK